MINKKLMKKEFAKLSTEDKKEYLSIHKNTKILSGYWEDLITKLKKESKSNPKLNKFVKKLEDFEKQISDLRNQITKIHGDHEFGPKDRTKKANVLEDKIDKLSKERVKYEKEIEKELGE